MIVGGPAFKRGQDCFSEGRVMGVESAAGELLDGLIRQARLEPAVHAALKQIAAHE